MIFCSKLEKTGGVVDFFKVFNFSGEILELLRFPLSLLLLLLPPRAGMSPKYLSLSRA